MNKWQEPGNWGMRKRKKNLITTIVSVKYPI